MKSEFLAPGGTQVRPRQDPLQDSSAQAAFGCRVFGPRVDARNLISAVTTLQIRAKTAVFLIFTLALLDLTGCVLVPQNRRGKLADPMMNFSSSRMDAYRKEKLQTTREGAAGGNGRPAGGGCACQ